MVVYDLHAYKHRRDGADGPLASALNNTYFQHSPEQVRPKTSISRGIDDITSFITEQNDKVVIKQRAINKCRD